MKNFKQYNEFRIPIFFNTIGTHNVDEDEFKYPVGRKNECESCGGHGFVLKRYQHPLLINPAETKCPDCHGTGINLEEIEE